VNEMTDRVSLELGDITQQQVDAIVNAANSSLLGGGGVDGAIHRAAGPGLLEECRTLGGCPTGEARITRGYDLRARWVIHTVGPIWRGGNRGEVELLAACYRNSLALATDEKRDISSIAFPSISTGAYGYPTELAATVALREVRKVLGDTGKSPSVSFVLFSPETFAIYEEALRELETG
jgi:O-acetyl-ADP-ribose deacetylase